MQKRMTFALRGITSLILLSDIQNAASSQSLPEPNMTCNDKRPPGVITTPIYCTKEQGFACEVLDVDYGFPKAHITIWNSYGCGCNWTLYNASPWSLHQRPNGPRIWTADNFVSDATANPKSLDKDGRFVTKDWFGIDYRYGAELDVPYSTIAKNLIFGNQPWTISVIQRTGARVWKAGRQVYEMVTDDHRVFIIQAVSMQVDATQTTNAGLVDLMMRPVPKTGKPMSLPSGWSYRCRVLAKDLAIESNGTASIMQDDFYNNYMEENIQPEYSAKPCVAETEDWRNDYCSSVAVQKNSEPTEVFF